ncbi:hypothetical protein SLA2020_318710 [Shorea laevis]
MFLRIAKLKPLASSVESSWGHQFLQQRPVSGTAKGKAKIKAGQTIKRSKMNTKKGQPDTKSGGGVGAKKPFEREDRLENLCLNAPTPVRYLTPRERAREAKREKLGLLSKDRKRELEMMKKKDYKEKMGLSEEPVIIGTPGLDLISLGLVDADKIPKYELTVEDGRRLAKEHSRVLMRRHRARQAAESTFLRLKKEAIEALPEDLRAEALVPDLSPFPVNRFMATLTPPIEGYIDKVKEAAKKSSGREKLR